MALRTGKATINENVSVTTSDTQLYAKDEFGFVTVAAKIANTALITVYDSADKIVCEVQPGNIIPIGNFQVNDLYAASASGTQVLIVNVQ